MKTEIISGQSVEDAEMCEVLGTKWIERREVKDKLMSVLTSPRRCTPNLSGDYAKQVFYDCSLQEAYILDTKTMKIVVFTGVSGLDEAVLMAEQMRGV